MRLKYFSRSFLRRLKDSAAQNVDRYSSEPEWLDRFANGESYALESKQSVGPPPKLEVSATNNAELDAENSIRIYEWLRELLPAVAMEERLWSYLAHCEFADYMRVRWPVDSAASVVRRYCFEGTTFAALCRNGISRLWWAGHLTYDASRTDSFELTRALFMRQDIQVSLLERSLGKCKNLRTAVLDFLLENREWLGSESFGRRIQLLLRELNLLGGVMILDTLSVAEIQSHLFHVANRLIDKKPSPANTAGHSSK